MDRASPRGLTLKVSHNLRLGRMLQLAFLLMVGMTAAVGVIAEIELTRVANTAELVAKKSLARAHYVANIGTDIAQSRAATLEVLTAVQLMHEDIVQAAKRTLADIDRRLKIDSDAYLRLIASPDEQALWNQLASGWAEYRKEQDRAIAAAEEGLAGEAQRILVLAGRAKFEASVSMAARLIDLNSQHAERESDDASSSAAVARRLVWALLAAAIVIGASLALSMTRAIVGPIRGVIELLQKMGSGHLDNPIDTSRRDEVGELLTGLSATQAALRARAEDERRHRESERQRADADRRTLEEVQQIVGAVVAGDLDHRLDLAGKEGYAAQLASSINGLVENVAEVIRGVTRIVEGANSGDLTQRISLDDRSGLERRIGMGINQLVEDMAMLIARVKEAAREVALGSHEISRGSESLSQRAEEQAASLEETAASMEEMSTAVAATANNTQLANTLAIDASVSAEQGGAAVARAIEAMGGINEAAQKIADIIQVIDGIAFQTNMLAVNAAVEAARAGDHGRGFAVVASEVRNLAGRSALAAKSIKTLIEDSVARVQTGSRLVCESGDTLEQLMIAVKKVHDILSEISVASHEQATGIDQVGKAVTQMDELTQHNAALAEEAAAASKSLADHASSLNDLLARYRVGGAQSGGDRALKVPAVVRLAGARPVASPSRTR